MATSSKLSLLSELALHILKRDGPLTTHQLYRACLATDAPAARTYKQPGHRDYRLIHGTVVRGTVPPPNPDHLARSVRHLKMTMREQRALGRVGLTEIDYWIQACKKAGTRVQDLLNEALVAKKLGQEEEDSPRVWVDGERFVSVLGDDALEPRAPKSASSPERKPLKPNYNMLHTRLGTKSKQAR